MSVNLPLRNLNYDDDDPLSATDFIMTPSIDGDGLDSEMDERLGLGLRVGVGVGLAGGRRGLRPSQGVAAGLPLICNGKGGALLEAPPWNPARKILTFMGIVCLICTLIVVGIVLLAVYLSQNAAKNGKQHFKYKPFEVFYVIPEPRKLENNKPKTIVIHRNSPEDLYRKVSQINTLLKEFEEKNHHNQRRKNHHQLPNNNSLLNYKVKEQEEEEEKKEEKENEEAKKKKICDSFCHFPLEKVDGNCSMSNQFGYPSGTPCIAVIFHAVPGWLPVPFDKETADLILPRNFRKDYDSNLIFLTCNAEGSTTGRKTSSSAIRVSYSPFQGYPRSYYRGVVLSSSPPPFVMIRFWDVPIETELTVTCLLWAKNVARSETALVPGKLTFNLLII